jgi:phosphoribosylglycinamide formyltransferase 1
LQNNHVDFIILAGFLRKIPDEVVHAYSDKIINVHPALLPKFGGKGMYGKYVHKAVKEANETETGITIHLVNEHYDEGRILFQASAPLVESDTSEDIGLKVQKLEHEHFARICEMFISEY